MADTLQEATRPELYIKTAIVIMGASLGVKAAGAAGLASAAMFRGLCAIIEAYLIYWAVVYFISRKFFKFSKEWAAPLVEGRIAAGHAGAIPGDYVTSMVWVYKPEIGRRQHHNLRAVKLASNATSMEPTIRRGSIVIIDPAEIAISKKGIYAVRLDQDEGACAIKRVKESGDFWFFLSDNPEVEPIVMKKERDHNPIIGRVIWSWTSWVR